MARDTGLRIIVDDDLRGRITVTAFEEVSVDEALEIMNAALLIRGYTAIPGPGDTIQVHKVEANATSAPWMVSLPESVQGRAVATLLRLEWAPATDVVAALKPLVSGAAVLVVAYERTNSVILAGSEHQVRRILTLLAEIDDGAREDVSILRPRHASARDARRLLRQTFLRGRAEPPFEIWIDERTNALIVRATPDELDAIRDALALFDVPAWVDRSIDVIPVRHRDPEKLADLLRSLGASAAREVAAAAGIAADLRGREFSVAVDGPTHSLVVNALPETVNVVREVVAELDRVPPRIFIEAMVMEISASDDLSLGIDFFAPLTRPKDPRDLIATALSNPSGGGLRASSGDDTGLFARFTRSPLLIPVTSGGTTTTLVVPRESAVFVADDREVRFRTLLRPQIVVLSGEEHEIFSGDNIPVPTAQTSAEGSNPLQVRQSIERQDVGVRLRVQPTLGQGRTVILDLDLESTGVAGSVAGDSSEVGPTILSRRLESTIRLRDGEIAVVGMATDEKVEELVRGTPFLRSIPFLGWAFKRVDRVRLRQHIVMAVEARVLPSSDELLAETIRRRLAMERSLARAPTFLGKRDAPYALRVATRRESQAAEDIAREIGRAGETRVEAWEYESARHFDVYLTGFSSLPDVGSAALTLRRKGYDPEVVVLRTEE